jgi:hypothetical protein
MLSTTVRARNLYIPGLSSNGALVEPMLEMGNDLWAAGAGYANLAGEHGAAFDASVGEWFFATRIFESDGWRGSWLLPDVHLEFAYFAGPSRYPRWMFGGTTRIAGLRIAKCLGKVSLETSVGADFGPMLVEIDTNYFSILAGGYFDMGLAFW